MGIILNAVVVLWLLLNYSQIWRYSIYSLDHISGQTYRWGSFHVFIWTMVVLFRWTLKFVDKVIHENHENWYPTNKSTFTVICPFHIKRFCEILLCGLRGVAMTRNRTDGLTDGRTGQKHYTLRNFVAWGIINICSEG